MKKKLILALCLITSLSIIGCGNTTTDTPISSVETENELDNKLERKETAKTDEEEFSLVEESTSEIPSSTTEIASETEYEYLAPPTIDYSLETTETTNIENLSYSEQPITTNTTSTKTLGKITSSDIITDSSTFYNGYAYIQKDKKNYIIDTTGNILFNIEAQPEYFNQDLTQGLPFYNYDNMYCTTQNKLVTFTNEIVLAPELNDYTEFVCIASLGDNIILALDETDSFEKQGAYLKFIDTTGTTIFDVSCLDNKISYSNIDALYLGNGVFLVNSGFLINVYSQELINLKNYDYDITYRLQKRFYSTNPYGNKYGTFKFENDKIMIHDMPNSIATLDSHGIITPIVTNNAINSEDMNFYHGNTYISSHIVYDINNVPIADLSAYSDYTIDYFGFTDGYALVILKNSSNSKYATLIDTNGNIQFEPIACENAYPVQNGHFVIEIGTDYKDNSFMIYDTQGNVTAHIVSTPNGEKISKYFGYSEGIYSFGTFGRDTYFYNANGNSAF